MELQRALLRTALILLFVQFGLSLNSRIEWLALVQLRSSLGIRGNDWPIKTEPCRNWSGVRCQKGRVVGINVSGLRRTRVGRLEPRFAVDSLANLTLLMSFNASGFLLNGSIPEWFGQRLSTLKMLDLSSCSLTGPIPSSLGSLSGLQFLNLSDNSLTGRMPSTLGQLSALSVLNLSRNSLTGSIPNSFLSLGNLTRLDLSSNFLSGSIPAYLGTLSSLHSLRLSDNGFTASIPVQLGNLSHLVQLDLRKNSFDGALPAPLWSMRSLHFLDVSSNSLTGSLPKLSSNINSTGAIFNLSNNLFYGFLNNSLTKSKKFDLSSNYFQGEAPDDGLSSATLARNCLKGAPNQRSFRDCGLFYAQRSLIYFGAQEPAISPLPQPESRNRKRVIFILAGTFGGLAFIVLLVLVLTLLVGKCDNSIANQKGTANVGPVLQGESPTPPKDPVAVTVVTRRPFIYEDTEHRHASLST